VILLLGDPVDRYMQRRAGAPAAKARPTPSHRAEQ
jgi:hypothetical protein